jgi:hypothetical protein
MVPCLATVEAGGAITPARPPLAMAARRARARSRQVGAAQPWAGGGSACPDAAWGAAGADTAEEGEAMASLPMESWRRRAMEARRPVAGPAEAGPAEAMVGEAAVLVINAALPMTSWRRRCMAASLPPVRAVPAREGGAAGMAAGAWTTWTAWTGLASWAAGPAAAGISAAFLPTRTRSCAGGKAALPTESALRWAIAAARPPCAASMTPDICVSVLVAVMGGALSVRRRGRR